MGGRRLQEYFLSEDVGEVLRSIKELKSPAYHYEIVKRGINMSLDAKDHEVRGGGVQAVRVVSAALVGGGGVLEHQQSCVCAFDTYKLSSKGCWGKKKKLSRMFGC